MSKLHRRLEHAGGVEALADNAARSGWWSIQYHWVRSLHLHAYVSVRVVLSSGASAQLGVPVRAPSWGYRRTTTQDINSPCE